MPAENLNLLEIVQEVFKEIREPAPNTLSSPSARTKEVLGAVKNIYLEVCSLNNGHMKFLEADGEITLTEGQREYNLAGDVKDINLEGWILDNASKVEYLDYIRFVNKYRSADEEGTPYNFTIWNGQALFGYTPSISYNGKKVKYSYWKIPDDVYDNEHYPLIPKEFRRRILVFGAVAHILQMDGDPSFRLFWDRYLGGIEDLKRGYCSIKPTKVRVTYIF